LKLYLERKISAGKAAELQGMRKQDFVQLLAHKGIPYFDYTNEEFRAVDTWKQHSSP
jgi:predicted HTH domain antitoxin